MSNKYGTTKQIPFGTFITILFLALSLFIALCMTIGFWSTIGFYGLTTFLVALIVARAPVTYDD